MNNKIHEGHNVKRFRELLGIKQDALAAALGEDWTQKKISLLEQKESIETDILAQVATCLKIPAQAIRNFDEDTAITIISNSFTECDEALINGTIMHYKCDFDPQEKWIEAMAEIKRLNGLVIKEKESKIELYERLLSELKNRT